MKIYPQTTLPRFAKKDAKAMGLTEFRIGQNDQFFIVYRMDNKGRWQSYPHDTRIF